MPWSQNLWWHFNRTHHTFGTLVHNQLSLQYKKLSYNGYVVLVISVRYKSKFFVCWGLCGKEAKYNAPCRDSFKLSFFCFYEVCYICIMCCFKDLEHVKWVLFPKKVWAQTYLDTQTNLFIKKVSSSQNCHIRCVILLTHRLCP